MKFVKYIKIGIPVFLSIVFILLLHKNLPRTAVVKITGTDVKRVEVSGKSQKVVKAKDGSITTLNTTDVRYINGISKKGKTMVFRNEDTGWGWPPYFKFDSADLTAQAQSFSVSAEEVWVRVRYYGWRIRVLDMFPNAVSLKKVDREYSHFPFFNVVFISTLLILGLIVRRKLTRLSNWVRGKKEPPAGAAE